MTTTPADTVSDSPEPFLQPGAAPFIPPGWPFVVQWVIISVAASFGLIVVTLVFTQAEVVNLNRVANPILGGLTAGVVLGGLHWTILRSYLPGANWWIVATTGGCGVGMVFYLLIQHMFPDMPRRTINDLAQLASWWPAILVSLATVVGMLIPSGACQALVLKRSTVSMAVVWLAVWVVSGLIALGLLILLIYDGQGAPIEIGKVLVSVLGIGAVWGMFTGVPLYLLLGRVIPSPVTRPAISARHVYGLAGALGAVVLLDVVLVVALFRPVLVFYENFEIGVSADDYTKCLNSSIEQDRLRIMVPDPYTGCDVPFSTYLGDFTMEATVHFVDSPYDGSINLSFRGTPAGWYEVQLRPGVEQIWVMKVVRENDKVTQNEITAGWTFTPDLEYRAAGNVLKLVAQGNHFTLWFNDINVYEFEDLDIVPFRRGQIRLGAGAAETANVGYEFDDIRIWIP